MPRVITLSVETPVTVRAATDAFGSELRVNLIRHYRETPGSQRSAVAALGVNSQVISNNTKVLIACGVVIVEDSGDKRSPICRVDESRLDELLAALSAFTRGIR